MMVAFWGSSVKLFHWLYSAWGITCYWRYCLGPVLLEHYRAESKIHSQVHTCLFLHYLQLSCFARPPAVLRCPRNNNKDCFFLSAAGKKCVTFPPRGRPCSNHLGLFSPQDQISIMCSTWDFTFWSIQYLNCLLTEQSYTQMACYRDAGQGFIEKPSRESSTFYPCEFCSELIFWCVHLRLVIQGVGNESNFETVESSRPKICYLNQRGLGVFFFFTFFLVIFQPTCSTRQQICRIANLPVSCILIQKQYLFTSSGIRHSFESQAISHTNIYLEIILFTDWGH